MQVAAAYPRPQNMQHQSQHMQHQKKELNCNSIWQSLYSAATPMGTPTSSACHWE